MGGGNDRLFDVGIATIFAREVLEGSIIVINYRSIIFRQDDWDEPRKKQALRTVTMAATIATVIATLVVIAVAIPLGILGRDLSDNAVAWVEGLSKLVATLFILHFSLKIPVWLGVYEKVPLCGLKPFLKVHISCGGGGSNKKEDTTNTNTANTTHNTATSASDSNDNNNNDNDDNELPRPNEEIEEEEERSRGSADHWSVLTLTEIRFNVIWNLWREVAECGVFLLPFFLNSKSLIRAIPISGVVGSGISLLLAMAIYQANQTCLAHQKGYLACLMASLTLMLSVGLLVGAVSEFQEIAMSRNSGGKDEDNENNVHDDDDDYVYVIQNTFWDDNRFPMVLIHPFGYTDRRTVAQLCCFWLYLLFGLFCHYVLIHRTRQVRFLRQQQEDDDDEEEARRENDDDEEAANSNGTRVLMTDHATQDDDKAPEGVDEEGEEVMVATRDETADLR